MNGRPIMLMLYSYGGLEPLVKSKPALEGIMKTLVLMFLTLTSACAFSQEPKIRLEKLSDAEYSAYRQASDARETAARAYLQANKDLDGVRAMIERKHEAREITPSCDSHYRRTSEWKGQYIIIDETDESDSPGITIGCGGVYAAPTFLSH